MKRITILVSGVALLTLGAASPAWSGGSADHQTSAVFTAADDEPIDGATAELTRTDSGVRHQLRTSGFTHEDAVTVWWVIFNHPDACEAPCDGADLSDPEVEGAVMSAGGHVVGESGHASFGRSLKEGQITAEHPAFTGGPGLTNPRGAEIHLVVRSHGPRVEEHMPEQIETFGGGCDRDITPTMPDEEGECADVQYAVFE